ncbi:MAG: gluconokinase [Chloroflexota bacterium]
MADPAGGTHLPPGEVAADEARPPFVLALDIGTSSLRTLLFDAGGQAVHDMAVHIPHQMRTTADGGVETDADPLVERAAVAIDGLVQKAGRLAPRIAAVAVDTFWHSLLGVDAAGTATTPLYIWADTRSAGAAQDLKGLLDEQAVHARTGCLFHASYLPAKLRWLHQSQPDLFRRTARWMSIGEYLYLRFFGHTVCSISMASATGLLNQQTWGWDEELLRTLELTPDHLVPLAGETRPLQGLADTYARRWPVLAGLPWFPALGDGARNNVGSRCVNADRIAVMVGTSGAMRVVWTADQVRVPPGLWMYRVDRHRPVLGGALSNGGNLFAWMREVLRVDSDVAAEEKELGTMAPDSHGLTVLPFLAGERSTGWAPHARAAFVGLTLHTRPVDILRAGLEAVALRFAAIYTLLLHELPDGAGAERKVIASGGALLHSPAWMSILASTLGCPVVASGEAEATSRGAALLALEALGIVTDLSAASVLQDQTYAPVPAYHDLYQRAQQRQRKLYDLLIAGGTEW